MLTDVKFCSQGGGSSLANRQEAQSSKNHRPAAELKTRTAQKSVIGQNHGQWWASPTRRMPEDSWPSEALAQHELIPR